MKINSYVIALKNHKNIIENSVGVINAINGDSALILFIGINEIHRMDLGEIKAIDIFKTGKGFEKKICNICHILKDENNFEINQTDAKGRKTTRPSCRVCRKNIDGKKLLNSEKIRMDKIAPKKGSVFVCPICEKRSIVDVTANLVRDHDHITGLGREWICDSCNTGLGRFKDNPHFLQKVIDYLKKF